MDESQLTILSKAGNTDRNTTSVLANDPDLSGAALSANKFYEIDSMFLWQSGATPDFKFAYVFTGSISWCQGFLEYTTNQVSNGSWTAGATVGQTNRRSMYKACFTTPLVVTLGGSAVGTEAGPVWLTAFIKVGDTGGNFSLQWAQATSNGANTRVSSLSYLYYKELLDAA